LLERAYNGELEPIPLNPYTEESSYNRPLACVKMTMKDLFPITPAKVI
jgi:hypothetical protein